MLSKLRFLTCASLIAFGGMISVGAPMLLHSVRQPLFATAGIDDPPALPCQRETWLQSDRNCLPGTTVPAIARAADSSDAVPVKVSSAASNALETPFTETPAPAPSSQALRSQALTPQALMLPALTPQAPTLQALPSQPLTPQALTLPAPVRQSAGQEPEHETPVPPRGAGKRHVVARSVTETPARLPAPKKAVGGDRSAKRSTNDALKVVRRFGDTLQDIPVSSYAADGTRRRIVIHPTSVQDVYYYSVPR